MFTVANCTYQSDVNHRGVSLRSHGETGFHLGFSSRGGKRDNCQAKGGEDYSNTSSIFSLARNIIVLIDFLKLGLHTPPGKFLGYILYHQ